MQARFIGHPAGAMPPIFRQSSNAETAGRDGMRRTLSAPIRNWR